MLAKKRMSPVRYRAHQKNLLMLETEPFLGAGVPYEVVIKNPLKRKKRYL